MDESDMEAMQAQMTNLRKEIVHMIHEQKDVSAFAEGLVRTEADLNNQVSLIVNRYSYSIPGWVLLIQYMYMYVYVD